jgi:hypothetical protein
MWDLLLRIEKGMFDWMKPRSVAWMCFTALQTPINLKHTPMQHVVLPFLAKDLLSYGTGSWGALFAIPSTRENLFCRGLLAPCAVTTSGVESILPWQRTARAFPLIKE